MFNNKSNNINIGKTKNGIRSNVSNSIKGGSFITPKIKYNGHH